MSIGKVPGSRDFHDLHASESGEISDIVLNIKKKKHRITKRNIKDIARGLSEVAYQMGETNNQEEYEEWVKEDIEDALKKVQKRRDKKGDNNPF